MIEFIICDDDKSFLSKVEQLINKFMMKKYSDYKIKKFADYNQAFIEEIDKKICPRIYILDIETPSSSGIYISKLIRKKDIESSIIFLTGHEELGPVLLRKDVHFLSFINKFEGFETRLISALENAMQLLGRPIYLCIKDNNIYYRIPFHTILYIYKDTVERKTKIVTDNNEFNISKALNKIVGLLDDRFIQTHRACYINKERVVKLDYKNKSITFDNNLKVADLLSKIFRKEEM